MLVAHILTKVTYRVAHKKHPKLRKYDVLLNNRI